MSAGFAVGQLRIIAGEFRRRKIRVPDGDVRPTSDRVREALFSILGASVEGARVLDLYAGSGALGFEALSRGALELWAVDSSRRCCETVEANARALGVVDRCRVLHAGVARALAEGRLTGPFRLIFADPPYGEEEERSLLPAVAGSGLLEPGGRLILEVDARTPLLAPDLPGLERVRETRYGAARVEFFQFIP